MHFSTESKHLSLTLLNDFDVRSSFLILVKLLPHVGTWLKSIFALDYERLAKWCRQSRYRAPVFLTGRRLGGGATSATRRTSMTAIANPSSVEFRAESRRSLENGVAKSFCCQKRHRDSLARVDCWG